MVELFDYSDWNLYDGFSEGSGRSEKHWLVSLDGSRIGLFKYPKYDPVSQKNTYEHVSEHLACNIGRLIDIPTAKVEIGLYKNRMGSMSYLINNETEELCEGLWFILGKHPDYNPDKMQDMKTGEFYSLHYLFEISDNEKIQNYWIRMLIFDFIIGNSDRHQNNWAFIVPIEDKNKAKIRIRPCPLYDNGSSLCSFIRDDQINLYLGKDIIRFNSLVDSKSRSMFRIDSRKKTRPTHSEVVKYLLNIYSQTLSVVEAYLSVLTKEAIIDLVNNYPDDLVNSLRKELLVKFLEAKVMLLELIWKEERM